MIVGNDRIKIGDLLSENYIEEFHRNKSASIGQLYNFKWRTDLTPQSANVRNAGASDASNVYEVITPRIFETILEEAQDIRFKTIGVIEQEHLQIHKGRHYYYDDFFALGGSATVDLVYNPNGGNNHLVFSVEGNEAGIEFELYEDVVANEDGTLLTVFNNNRLSANVPDTTIRLNPTGVDITGSSRLRGSYAGVGGATAQRVGGEVSRSKEIILDGTKKYLVRITNLSNATNNIDINFNWYELGN